MTLSEAFNKLQSGSKLTYPGLDGYIYLKDGKLVTELDAGKSFSRDDWKEYKDSTSRSQRIDVNLSKKIDEIVDSFLKSFRSTWI